MNLVVLQGKPAHKKYKAYNREWGKTFKATTKRNKWLVNKAEDLNSLPVPAIQAPGMNSVGKRELGKRKFAHLQNAGIKDFTARHKRYTKKYGIISRRARVLRGDGGLTGAQKALLFASLGFSAITLTGLIYGYMKVKPLYDDYVVIRGKFVALLDYLKISENQATGTIGVVGNIAKDIQSLGDIWGWWGKKK